ncbi:MAG: Formimidoylglutamase [Steroidobacteraceae bacterium]|nr:Formimidoylglutamase [Steroidobacteraceae bacterium]
MTTGTWQGRIDAADGDSGRRWHQIVQPLEPGAPPGVALLGFACDEGVRRNQGRIGASGGPQALRRALAPLAYHGSRGTPLYDAGDIECQGEDLEGAQRSLGARVAALLARGHFPMLLGGGHEIAWGSFQGTSAALERDGRLARFGVVNFDAHFDLRRGPANSGTPFRQIHDALAARGLPFRYLCLGIARAANTPALFATARDCGATWLHDEELVWPRWDAACRAIDAFVDSVDALQLSVCLDAFPAGAAPGVSAPAARGIAPDFALSLLGHLLARARHGGKGSKVVLAEVAELAPCLDPDGRTARLAGRVVYDVVSGLL